MKLKVEVTRLGDQVTLQASPEIKQFRFGTRVAETTLSLKDDETVVLAGLIQE
jgi:type II secretory pathway component GspD/PulD (secretin)